MLDYETGISKDYKTENQMVFLSTLPAESTQNQVNYDYKYKTSQPTNKIQIPKPIEISVTTLNENHEKINFHDKSSVSVWVQVKELLEGLEFIYPVMIKIILCTDGIFIAECTTFEIFASGASYEEALDNIKGILVEDYKSFLEDYPNGLTETAKDLLRLYRAFLGENLPLEA